jgi:hypothetical protein
MESATGITTEEMFTKESASNQGMYCTGITTEEMFTKESASNQGMYSKM